MKKSPQNKNKPTSIQLHSNEALLKLCLRFLKDEASESEGFSLIEQIEELLKNGNQQTLDFLTAEIKKTDFEEQWVDYLAGISTSELSMQNRNGDEVDAILVIIPLVFGVHAKTKDQPDPFEIGVLGDVREIMAKSGLISDGDENFSMLPELLSLDDLALMTDTQKYRTLQFLRSGDPKYCPNPEYRVKLPDLRTNVIEVRFKFILGCAFLKTRDPRSPLFTLLDPDENESEGSLDRTADVSAKFSNELSTRLPELIKKNEAVEFLTTYAGTPTEFSLFGLRQSIYEFDRFKRKILLGRAKSIPTARITVSQSKSEVLDITLFDGNDPIDAVQISSLQPSVEAMNAYLGEMFDDIEAHGFHMQSSNDRELIFSRKKPTVSPSVLH